MSNVEFVFQINVAYPLLFLITLRNSIINRLVILKNYSPINSKEINANMPLRFLQYAARLYERIQNPRDRYLRRLKKIPTPEFYMFYNGEEDYPESTTLRLSDAFMTIPEKQSLELLCFLSSGKVKLFRFSSTLDRSPSL